MSEETKRINGHLVRTSDGARWSAILGDWVPIRGARPVKQPKRYTRVKRHTGNRSVLRAQLAEAQNWRCCYCGERVEAEPGDGTYWSETLADWIAPPVMRWATIDHVIELSKGGTDTWENLVMACYDCNDQRGNKMTAEAFYTKKQEELRNGRAAIVDEQNATDRGPGLAPHRDDAVRCLLGNKLDGAVGD